MKSYTIKVVEAFEEHKQEIAKQWSNFVTKNPWTKSFVRYSENEMITIATGIYSAFHQLFFSDKLKETAQQIFGRYAEDRYRDGIPCQEALYALILMRRHIWFFAEFKTVFVSALEHYQKEETLNRTILVFDYAFFTIVEKYERLRNSDK